MSSIRKVYISENISDILFKIQLDFKNEHLTYDSKPSVGNILTTTRPTLLPIITKCYLNLDLLSEASLLEIAPEVKQGSIWVFKKLRKNSKLYKLLKHSSSVEELTSINYYKDRISYVKECLKSKGLPIKYAKTIADNSGDSRSSIYNEVCKLKIAESVLEKPEECLSYSVGEKVIFDFLESLVSGNTRESFKTYSIIKSDIEVFSFSFLLGKYILFNIMLREGCEEDALNIWRIPKFLLPEKRKISNLRSKDEWCELYIKSTDILTDYFSLKTQDFKMKQVMFLFSNTGSNVLLF